MNILPAAENFTAVIGTVRNKFFFGETFMARRNNGVRLEGTSWITAIECRGEGLAIKYKIRTDRSWLGGHHECHALNHMGAEVLAFALAHQVARKGVVVDADRLTMKAIVDGLNQQHTIQVALEGWLWSDAELHEYYIMTDVIYHMVSEQERRTALHLVAPLEKFFKRQVQPLLVSQTEQKTIPLNKTERRIVPPLLDIKIPELNYDELYNMDPESRAERLRREP